MPETTISIPATLRKNRKKKATPKGLEAIFTRYAAPGAAVLPVLVAGEPGCGKTYASKQFADSAGFDHVEYLGGDASLTAADLIGVEVPHQGGLVWKDGTLSHAFRRASRGEKVLLFVDEVYRIPARERSTFLHALNQHETTDGLVYTLKTMRPILDADGLAHDELLTCPVANLAIIATTNVGLNYHVEEDDSAGWERWIPVHHAVTDQELQAILAGVAKKIGVTNEAATKVARFYTMGRKATEQGRLDNPPNVRTCVRLMRLSASSGDLIATANDLAMTWVGRSPTTGEPLDDQLKAFRTLVRSTLGA